MKITVDRDPLVAALASVTRATERRSTIPILANLLLRADVGVLRITGSDLDLEVTTEIEAHCEAPGAVTVPALMLQQLASRLPAGAEVGLETEGNHIVLHSGRRRSTLNTLPQEDFPSLPLLDAPEGSIALPAATLAAALATVSYAISTEETRYYLCGIYLEPLGSEGCNLVATDGHRLAKKHLTGFAAGSLVPESGGVILPRKAVQVMAALVKDGKDSKDTVQMDWTDAKCALTAGKTRVISKLIDGTFPDYTRVIPTGNELLLTARREDMAQSVAFVSTVATDKTSAVKLSLSEDTLKTSVASADSGKASDEMLIDWDGAAFEIGVNSKYLAEILSLLPGTETKFAFRDPGTAMLITVPGDETQLHVLMPMRV